ncbi:hypothetical protein CkaCkLH20_13024 [Colletotrichum karsti]|uniref:Uncharacterized protein n=1 Tax=Colletotrichum karsti TaxID=1095194 RepID=A0A9P6HVC1_9PEZI|nr:uncharacterized protein CkaCkLH20_13024 [Colletotrichum karsti]KAF9869486.1 hypothetical protein CkaCkLH20_13024 [Colletotrichum karsti]
MWQLERQEFLRFLNHFAQTYPASNADPALVANWFGQILAFRNTHEPNALRIWFNGARMQSIVARQLSEYLRSRGYVLASLTFIVNDVMEARGLSHRLLQDQRRNQASEDHHYNYLVHFDLVKFGPIERDVILNRLQPSVDPRSDSAEDDLKNSDKTIPSLSALQKQLSRVLYCLAISNGKIRAIPKNWSSEASLRSSSCLLGLVEVREHELNVTVLVRDDPSETTPATPASGGRLCLHPHRRGQAFGHFSNWLKREEWSQLRPSEPLEMARTSLVTANLDFPEKASPDHHGHRRASLSREQVLVLYAAVLDEADALLSDFIPRINHTVAVGA